MINSFYIKQLKCTNKSGDVSTIDLINGLNVIHGFSNTGKTLIISTLDYMFGADTLEGLKNQIFITMTIETDKGNLIIKRNIEDKKNYVEVSSTVNEIDSGKYNISKNEYSNLLLKLIGITEPKKILKNKDFKSQSLTWRIFSHLFTIKETEIIRSKSILLPAHPTSNTAFISSLIYLINAKDQGDIEALESKETKKARILALKNYISNQIIKTTELKSELDNQITNMSKEYIFLLYILFTRIAGGYREVEIPSSIPNLEVKHFIADNTAGSPCGNVGRCQL